MTESADLLRETIAIDRYKWPLPSEDEEYWFIVNPEASETWKSIQKTKPLFSQDKPLHFAFVNTDSTVEYNESLFKKLHKFIIDHSERLKSVILHFACAFPSHPSKDITKPSFLDWKWCTSGSNFNKLEYLYLGDPKFQITKGNKAQISRFLPFDLENSRKACEMISQSAKEAFLNAEQVSTVIPTWNDEEATVVAYLAAIQASKIVKDRNAAENLALATENVKEMTKQKKIASEKVAHSKHKKNSKKGKEAAKEFANLVTPFRVLKQTELRLRQVAKMDAELAATIDEEVAALSIEVISVDLVIKTRLEEESSDVLLFLARKMVADTLAKMEREMAEKQKFPNLKHFALVGVDSERTIHKILTFAIEKNGKEDIDCTMHFSYGKKSKISPWTGTPYHILQEFAFYSPELKYKMKKPREYEYALMTKFAYSLKKQEDMYGESIWLKGLKVRNGVFGVKPLLVVGEEEEIPKEMPDYFWLTMRGWRCAKFIHEPFYDGSHYTAAILTNKYTRQIVLATRGTVVNAQDFGALSSDIRGVVFSRKCGQHKAAQRFLHNLLEDIEGTSDKPMLDNSIFGNVHIVPTCKPKHYNVVEGKEILLPIHSGFNLTFTGHSLGAWLSEVLVAEACLKGYYTSSVTFDSPGSSEMITKLLKCNLIKLNLDCLTFLSSPNLVNTCNRHVGEVRSILKVNPSAIETLQRLGNAHHEWLASCGAFHSSDNFANAGSRFQKDILAANHIGEWPVNTDRSLKSIFLVFAALCKGHFTYLINKSLQRLRDRLTLQEKTPLTLEEWNKSSDQIREIAKGSKFPLELREYYSFPLIRLHPRAQQLVEIYTSFASHMRAEIFDSILPEFRTLMEPIIEIKSNRIVTMKAECRIVPLKLVNEINSFSKAEFVIKNHNKMELKKVGRMKRQVNSFTTHLFHLLSSPESLQKVCLPIIRDTFHHLDSSSDGEHVTCNTIRELKKYLSSPEGQGRMNAREKQKWITLRFNSILKTAIKKARKKLDGRKPLHTEFAILALGSWGRDCPLPDGHHKHLLMITDSLASGSSSSIGFEEFCSEIVAECEKAGIFCKGGDIKFGSKIELFRSYVLGDHINSMEYPPSEENDINGCLLRLCTIWDSNCIYGDRKLFEQFKDIFESIIDGKDKNQFRRDRQFMKSFFHHIQSKLQTGENLIQSETKIKERVVLGLPSAEYLEKPLESLKAILGEEGEDETEVNPDTIRHIYLDLLNIITFLSLFDRVRVTNPWERIQEITAKGTVSEKLGSQLLCCWNVVHTLYVQGEEELIGRVEIEPMDSSEVNRLGPILKDIFFFIKNTFIRTMGKKCQEFLKSLDAFSKKMNPFYEDFYEPSLAEYFAYQANQCSPSLETADLWDQAHLHNPTKRMTRSCTWPDPDKYRSKIEKEIELSIAIPTFDIPTESGIRPFAKEQERIFFKHLDSITDHTGKESKLHYTFWMEHTGESAEGSLIESVAKQIMKEQTYKQTHHKETHSFSIDIPELSKATSYRCTLLSDIYFFTSNYFSLRCRISGFSVPSFMVTLFLGEQQIPALFIKEIRGESVAPLEALSSPLRIQYSLQFLQSLILLPETEESDIIWPSQIEEREPLAFCSKKVVEPSTYSYTNSALLNHPQFYRTCHPEAISIFLCLSPFTILQSWLNDHGFCVQPSTAFLLALFHRFTLLQTILRCQDFNSPLSHIDVLKMMPDVMITKDGTFISCLPKPIERYLYYADYEGRFLYRRIQSHTTTILSISEQLYICENSSSEEVELFDLFSQMTKDEKYGEIASLALQCFNSKQDEIRELLSQGCTETLLRDGEGLFQVSFKLLPGIDQSFVKKVLKSCTLTLCLLDLSNTSLSSLSWLKSLTTRSSILGKRSCLHLQTLVLNNVKMKSFKSEYLFPVLISLSLEYCTCLTKADLNADQMPFLQSVSFNDSTAFTTLTLSGNHEERKYPLNISLLRTSVSADINHSLGLPLGVPVFKNTDPENNSLPNDLNANFSPVFLQIDDTAVKKHIQFHRLDVLGKKSAMVAEVGNSCTDALGSVQALFKSSRKKELISGLEENNTLWNAVAIKLPGVILSVESALYWRTLALTLQHIELNEEQKETSLHLIISYMANAISGTEIMSAEEENSFISNLWETPALLHKLSKSELKIFHSFCASQAIGGNERNIAKVLQSSNTPLNSLNITDNYIGDKGAAAIAEALQSTNTSLTSLYVKFNKIGEKGAAAIAEALQSPNTSLTSLDISNNNMGEEGAVAIAQALQSPNTSLTSLDISMNQIGEEGAAAIAEALQSTDTSLTSLYIKNNGIGEEGAAAIGRALQSPNTSLTSLHISNNSIGEKGAAAIAEALQSFYSFLTSLNISDNWIGHEGAVAIAKALQSSNTSLTSLNISYNDIGDEGAAAIAQALQSSNTFLTSLDIAGNQIGEEGAVTITETLKSSNTSLTSLHLENNQIGYEGAVVIAEALQSPNTSLTSLDIEYNNIGDKGAVAIAQALQSSNSSLTSLNIKDNDIGDEGAAAIAKALQSSNTSLTSLNIKDNYFSDKIVVAIAQALQYQDNEKE